MDDAVRSRRGFIKDLAVDASASTVGALHLSTRAKPARELVERWFVQIRNRLLACASL
jgi:hypothetical protein